MKNEIILMLCYARSGGTLLNRCLSSLPEVIVFSEINPEATWLTKQNTISKQSKLWYNIKIKKSDLISETKQIINLCNKNDLNLIIRDFSYGSFVPRSYNSFKPSSKLFTLNTLLKGNIVVKPFAFVRNAKDIWISMDVSKKRFYDKEFNCLYKFTKLLIENKIKIFKYEDFCLNPESEMKKICKYIGVPYSSKFKEFNLNFNVIGDTREPTSSRGLKKNKITPLPRRNLNKKQSIAIENNTNIKKINKLLSYTD